MFHAFDEYEYEEMDTVYNEDKIDDVEEHNELVEYFEKKYEDEEDKIDQEEIENDLRDDLIAYLDEDDEYILDDDDFDPDEYESNSW